METYLKRYAQLKTESASSNVVDLTCDEEKFVPSSSSSKVQQPIVIDLEDEGENDFYIVKKEATIEEVDIDDDDCVVSYETEEEEDILEDDIIEEYDMEEIYGSDDAIEDYEEEQQEDAYEPGQYQYVPPPPSPPAVRGPAPEARMVQRFQPRVYPQWPELNVRYPRDRPRERPRERARAEPRAARPVKRRVKKFKVKRAKKSAVKAERTVKAERATVKRERREYKPAVRESVFVKSEVKIKAEKW